ncbi:MAG: hypothetical protein RL660_1951 [Bacteroidota bacterium]|jgi:hypothetical protein
MDDNKPNLELEFSCKEDYDAMPCTNNGRHCSKCNHEVIDCTNMSSDEIAALQQKHTQGFCGRFALSQMSANYLKAQLISTAVAIAAAQGCTGSDDRKTIPIVGLLIRPEMQKTHKTPGLMRLSNNGEAPVVREDSLVAQKHTWQDIKDRLHKILSAAKVTGTCTVRIGINRKQHAQTISFKQAGMSKAQKKALEALLLKKLKHDILLQNAVEDYVLVLP